MAVFLFLFKLWTRFHIFIYRASNGRWLSEVQGLPILLLTTTGRKSGKTRTTPLGALPDGDNYVIIASNGGMDKHPAWYFNLQANPRVTIQVRDQVMKATASTATAETRAHLWSQLIKIAPGYAGYEKRTQREIPVVVLQPVQ